MAWPTDDEVANGSILPELDDAAPIADICGMQVRLVDSTVPTESRTRIAHLAYVAQRSMSRFKTGYDGTTDEDDQRLYVLCSAHRAIGLVLTALQGRFWKVAWASDGSVCRMSEHAIVERRPTIARVWLATNKRGNSLGRKLVECALSHLHVPAVEVGWEFPFTEDGSRIVSSICPRQFLVCCDPMVIMLNTRPCADSVGESKPFFKQPTN